MADNDLRILLTAKISAEQKDISNLNNQIEQLSKRLKNLDLKLNINTDIFNSSIVSANNSITKIKKDTDDLSNSANKTGQSFATAFTKMIQWSLVGTAIFGTKRAIEDMISTVIELDTQMVQLKRVMDSNTNFDDMLKGSMSIANELGQKVTDINKALIDAAQAGYKANDALDITRTAVVASNVSDMTPQESMSNMIAAMKAFNIEASNSITIVDRLNEVDNNYSVSTKNLADSVTHAGAAAKTYGVTLDQLIGYTTAIGEVTRESGSVIGNMEKSMFSRLYTSDSIDALKEVGIEVKTLNGENRNASDILSDLGTKWNTLSSTQQQNTGVTIAGRNHLTRFLAMLNNFDTAVAATKTSVDSQGSAMRENAKYMDSMQAKINLLSTAWEQLSRAAGQSGLQSGFVSLVEVLTSMTAGLSVLISHIGILPPVIGLATTALLFFNRTSVATGALKLSTFIRTVSDDFRALGVSGTFAVGALAGVRTAMTSLLISTGVGAAIAGVAWAVSLLVENYQKQKAEEKAFADQQKLISDNWNNQKDKISSLIAEYNSLDSIKTRTTAQEEKYLKVSNDLANLMPNLVKSIDDKGNKHLKNADAIAKELEYAEKLANLDNAKKVTDAENTFNDKLKERLNLESQLAQVKTVIQDKGYVNGEARSVLSDAELKALEMKALGLEQQIAGVTDKLKEDVTSLTGTIIKMSGVKFGDDVSAELDKIVNKIDVSKLDSKGFVGLTTDIANSIKTIQDVSKSGTSDTTALTAYSQALDLLKTDLKLTDTQVQSFVDKLNGVNSATSNASNGIIDLAALQTRLTDAFETTTKTVQPLNDAIDKMQQGHSLTSSEITALLKKYPDLIGAFTSENGMLKINVAALEEKRDAEINGMQTSLLADVNSLASQEKALIAKLSMYGVEIDAINSVADAKRAAASIRTADPNASEIDIYGAESALLPQLNAIGKAKEAMNALQNAAKSGFKFQNSINTPNTKPKKEPATPTPYDDTQKYQIDEYKRDLRGLDVQLKESESVMTRYKETSEEYRVELQKQMEITKEKQKLTAGEGTRLRGDIADLESQIASTGDQKKKNALLQQLDQAQNNLAGLTNTWWDYQIKIEQGDKKLKESLFNFSKDWIANEIAAMQTAGKTKTEIAQMEYDAWLRIQDKKELTLAQQEEANKEIAAKRIGLDNAKVDEAIKRGSDALDPYTQKIKDLNKVINSIRSTNAEKINSQSALQKTYEEERIEIEKNITSLEKLSGTLNINSDAYKKNQDEIRKQKDLLDGNQSSIDAENQLMRNQIIEQLKQGYETQKKLQEQQLTDNYNAQVEGIKKQVRALEEQKTAIDRVVASLRDQWKIQDDNLKLSQLQHEETQVMSQKNFEIIDASGIKSYTYDVQKVWDIEKQLNDEKVKMSRDAEIKKYDGQKTALQNQIQTYQDQESALRTNYDNQKNALNEYWSYRTSQTQLQQEADNMIAQEGYKNALIDAQKFVTDMGVKWDGMVIKAQAAAAAIAAALGGGVISPTLTGGGGSSSSNRSGSSTGSGGGTQVIWVPGIGNTTTFAGAPIPSGGHLVPQYKDGGWIGSDQIAQLHSNEEVIGQKLTAKTMNAYGAKPSDVLKNIPNFANMQLSGMISNITEKIQSNLIKPFVPNVSSMGSSVTQTFSIDKLEFPNVRTAEDAQGFASQLGNIFKRNYFNSQAGEMS